MSAVPPITCEISEPGHSERGHCVPLMRNALALLVKEKASFGQEFWRNLEKCCGDFLGGWVGDRKTWAGEEEALPTAIPKSWSKKHSKTATLPHHCDYSRFEHMEMSRFFILRKAFKQSV